MAGSAVTDPYLAFRDQFAALMDQRCYSLEWLDQRVWTGDAVVFGNDRAAIVVELREYPAGAVEVHGLVAAGELATVIELIETAEQWGRQRGAVLASIASRPGWARALKRDGWQIHQVEIRKEL